MFFVFVLFLLFALGIFSLWNNFRSKREFAKRNLKFVKVTNLFFATIFGERVEVTKSVAIEKHGRIFGFNMLGQYTIMVAEPELLESIMCTNFVHFAEKRVGFNFRVFSYFCYSLVFPYKIDNGLSRFCFVKTNCFAWL